MSFPHNSLIDLYFIKSTDISFFIITNIDINVFKVLRTNAPTAQQYSQLHLTIFSKYI